MRPSQVALLQLFNGTVHKFHEILLFMKIQLASTFIFKYVMVIKDDCAIHYPEACIEGWVWHEDSAYGVEQEGIVITFIILVNDVLQGGKK